MRKILLIVAALALTQTTVRPQAQRLPPLSYVCDMAGDEGVLEDKPGICPNPACKMTLRPVRLDAKFWCPTHQTLEVHDAAGKCRRDGRDLVPVTLSMFWTCPDQPDTRLLEPGTCADSSARRIRYEVRAHGDHNPRHGGQFFMASDAWHHLEGTYPQPGVFRAYFYDNFTKPLDAKAFAGRVIVGDSTDKEVASAPLRPGADASTLEAAIAADTPFPVRLTLQVRFSPGAAEQPFDFQFAAVTK